MCKINRIEAADAEILHLMGVPFVALTLSPPVRLVGLSGREWTLIASSTWFVPLSQLEDSSVLAPPATEERAASGAKLDQLFTEHTATPPTS